MLPADCTAILRNGYHLVPGALFDLAQRRAQHAAIAPLQRQPRPAVDVDGGTSRFPVLPAWVAELADALA